MRNPPRFRPGWLFHPTAFRALGLSLVCALHGCAAGPGVLASGAPMLGGAGVDVIHGRARFVGQHTVAVGDRRYSAEKILICTGAWPNKPEFEGSEHMITSNEVFHLKKLPRKAVADR